MHTLSAALIRLLRAFRSRASLHNIRAGGAALPASVSSALGDTPALSVGLVILSPARSYELSRGHLRRAHCYARPHTRTPCCSGATRSLAEVALGSDAAMLSVAASLKHER